MTIEPPALYDASVIGVEVDVGSREITAEHILAYCTAVGDMNPLYIDPVAAAAGPHGVIMAPPAMVTAAATGQGLDPSVTFGNSTFNGGQHCDFTAAVLAGDVISARSAVHSIYEKTGRTGRMLFVVRRTTYSNQRREVVAVIDSSTVHREVERG